MQNYLFLAYIYMGLTALTFLFPKALRARNHITNAVLMAFFLVLVELIVIPGGTVLTFEGIIENAVDRLPDIEKLKDPKSAALNLEKLKDNFIYSILLPMGFFALGWVLYGLKKISVNTFDTIYTGLFPFMVYFDFIVFMGIDGIGGLIWHYVLFFIAYGFFAFSRMEFFMFLGIKGIVDDYSIKDDYYEDDSDLYDRLRQEEEIIELRKTLEAQKKELEALKNRVDD